MKRLAVIGLVVLAPLTSHAQSMWSGGPIVVSEQTALTRVPEGYRDMVAAASEESGFSVALIDALIRAESGYDAKAVSKKGALGLVQIMPETAKELELEDSFDAEANLAAGLLYLADQLETFGSLSLALAAYNAGPGAVTRHGGIPPYPETRAYVAKILNRAGLLINPPRSTWRGAIGSARASSAFRSTQSPSKGDVS